MMVRTTLLSTSILLLALASRPAEAHAQLQSSLPTEASRLDIAPTHVTLVFSEGAKLTSLKLHATGEAAARSVPPDASGVATSHTIPLPTITPGSYSLDWRALSNDSHVSSGTLHFSVRLPATAKP
jgi:methionine-rich copper-binding protein CopC